MKTSRMALVVLVMMVLAVQLSVPGLASGKGLESEAVIALQQGNAGSRYEFQIPTEGGLAPLRWKIDGGELPPGIELLQSGTLRGTPTAARGTPYIFEIEVSDSSSPPQTFIQKFSLMVQAAPLRMTFNKTALKIVGSGLIPAGATKETPAGEESAPRSRAKTKDDDGNGAPAPADNGDKTSSGNGASSSPSDEKNPPDLYDWGRVRAHFSGGAIFSKEREDFSKNDIYLGFNVDKNWLKRGRINFNTYLDIRLTSAPINVEDTSSDESGGEAGGDKQEAEEPPLPDTFLASKKTALLQLGLYAPITMSTWDFDGSKNAVFLAPILKAGIQTITSGFKSAEAETFGRDDVFNFGSFGIRLGHAKLSTSNDSAHELISYLDITRGKWENFEVLLPVKDANGNTIPDPGDPTKALTFRERRWRWGFEGRLMIPRTPFLVGFDANLGDGADDVRFLFGTRFDVGRLFGLLKKGQEAEKEGK